MRAIIDYNELKIGFIKEKEKKILGINTLYEENKNNN